MPHSHPRQFPRRKAPCHVDPEDINFSIRSSRNQTNQIKIQYRWCPLFDINHSYTYRKIQLQSSSNQCTDTMQDTKSRIKETRNSHRRQEVSSFYCRRVQTQRHRISLEWLDRLSRDPDHAEPCTFRWSSRPHWSSSTDRTFVSGAVNCPTSRRTCSKHHPRLKRFCNTNKLH